VYLLQVRDAGEYRVLAGHELHDLLSRLNRVWGAGHYVQD
jgi:hypothetical protein